MDDDDDRSSFFRRTDYNPNTRIMITAIISLSFVVLLITLLHIYARWVLRRQARRRDTLRRLGFIPSTAIIQTTEPPKNGLDPAVIEALPKFVFKQAHVDQEKEECAVCLSFLEDGNVARTLPNCKHTFHAECIDKWFDSNSTCPICRTGAEPRLVPEPREGVEVATVVPPTVPPLEGMSDGSAKVLNGSSSSRLSSFRRMVSWERSSRRVHVQSCGQELEATAGAHLDLEMQ